MLRLPTIFKTLSILLLSVIIISCSTDDGGPNDIDTPRDQGIFSAQVNGDDFNPPFKTGFLTTSINTILLTGSEGDGEQIQIFIPLATQPGTYSLESGNNAGLITYYQFTDGDANEVAAFATSGSITITTNNPTTKRIEGTFNFMGVVPDTNVMYTVTNGAFALNYTDI